MKVKDVFANAVSFGAEIFNLVELIGSGMFQLYEKKIVDIL